MFIWLEFFFVDVDGHVYGHCQILAFSAKFSATQVIEESDVQWTIIMSCLRHLL